MPTTKSRAFRIHWTGFTNTKVSCRPAISASCLVARAAALAPDPVRGRLSATGCRRQPAVPGHLVARGLVRAMDGPDRWVVVVRPLGAKRAL